MLRYVLPFAATAAAVTFGCDHGGMPTERNHRHHSRAQESAASDAVRLTDAQSRFADIRAEKASRRKSKCILKAMGKLLAPKPQTAIVSHAFSGRVAEVHVAVGDWVEEGQPLITLESHEVGEAKSEFYKATADLELARLNLQREERLMEQEIGVQKNLVAAEAAFKIAQSNAEAAEKTLHVLGFNEDQVKEIAETHQISPQITLFAPITGRIVASEAVLGALVDASSEILRIIDTTMLWVDAEIYEKDIAKVRIGQKVEIVVPAYPEKGFHGDVSYVGTLVDEETRTITVRAEVQNPEAQLKPGMFADVKILLNGNSAMLMIPCPAILQDGNKKIVFVQSGDEYERREVETGSLDGEYRQILSGLDEGDKVVIEGNYQLRSVLLSEALQAGHTH